MSISIHQIHKREEASTIAYDMVKKNLAHISPNAKVIIKPNITAPMPPSTGVTTHHEIVLGVISALSEFKNVYVVESDATSSDFEENVIGAGYSFLYDYKKINFVNLSTAPRVKAHVKGRLNAYEIEIPELLMNYDVLINLPVMKTHILTGISLGIKNLFGLLPVKNKSQYHFNIHDFLLAILNIFPTDLTILDGLVGMKGLGPIFGDPADSKIMLASTDIVMLDAIAAKIMGVDPFSIPYLEKALASKTKNRVLPDINIEGAWQDIHFDRVPTLPVQIMGELAKHKRTFEELVEQVNAPLQTKRNLHVFIDKLLSYDLILKNNDELAINYCKLDTLFSMFPEVEHIVSTQSSQPFICPIQQKPPQRHYS